MLMPRESLVCSSGCNVRRMVDLSELPLFNHPNKQIIDSDLNLDRSVPVPACSAPGTEIAAHPGGAQTRMAATVWKGFISFGLVSIPVRLYSGARGKTVNFHLLHEKDHSRVPRGGVLQH
jgi:hypothetical protein